MEKIVVCLFALLFMVKAGTVRSLYDEGSKAEYRFHDEPTTWLTAYTTCVKEGGRLAVATNENKAFFQSHFPKDVVRVFLGFNKWESGSWRTIQYQTLSEAGYEHWASGEPNNAGGSQRCGAIYKDGTFDDCNCNEKSPFICQINTFPEGYTYYESTKTYYKFHVQPATWLTAYTTCIEESGHLAIINSQQEADFFVRNFPKNSGSVFLGFNNWERDNSWFTIDGEPLSEVGYEKWAPGEPNTGGGIQRCGAMYKSGKFDDDFCNIKRPFICEKKSNSNAAESEIKRNNGIVRALYDEGSKAEYRFHDEPTTWLTAYTTCVKEGGRLAVATNDNKAFFQSHFPEDVVRVFLGFNKWESGSWRTIGQYQTLSEVGYEHWASGEPNNAGGSQRCGAIYKDGTFDDCNCNEKSPFICQINTFPEGYTYYESTKTYYKFHVQPATWLTAHTTCIKESGHLAIINSQEEADFFVNNFPKNSGSVFLGFNNWERDNSWFTIDGEPLSEVGYEKWAPGEPNTGGGIQRCGAMYKSGKFDDDFCNVKRPFICEKKSNSNAAEREIKRNYVATDATSEATATGTDDSYSISIGDETVATDFAFEETTTGTDDWYSTSIGDETVATDSAFEETTTGTDDWYSTSIGDETVATDSAFEETTTGTDDWYSTSIGDETVATDFAFEETTTGTDDWYSTSIGDETVATDSAFEETTTGTDDWYSTSIGDETVTTDSAFEETTTGTDDWYSTSIGDETVITDASSEDAATGTDDWYSTSIGDETDGTGSEAYETETAPNVTDNWYDRTTPGDYTDVDASRCEDSPHYVLFCKKIVRSKQCHRKNFKKMCCESCSKAAKRA